MTDRELLELAAKAAGIDAFLDPYGGDFMVLFGGPTSDELWAPLHSDGDALRLAVKLGMCVRINHRNTEVRCAQNDGDLYVAERFEGGADIATRRAIVRAAAETGKDPA